MVWVTWDEEGVRLGSFLYNLFSPSIWVIAAVNWALGVLPVLVLRKFYLTGKLLMHVLDYPLTYDRQTIQRNPLRHRRLRKPFNTRWQNQIPCVP